MVNWTPDLFTPPLSEPASAVDCAGSGTNVGRGVLSVAAPAHRGASSCAGSLVGVPCQNPGCFNLIVPANASDEHCPQCGHSIAVEADAPPASSETGGCAPSDAAVKASASHSNSNSSLEAVQVCRESDLEEAQEAAVPSHKNASAPSLAGPRSIAARVVELCKALGILSQAEEDDSLPF